MRHFLFFSLCIVLAFLCATSASFAQYGKATEQNVTTSGVSNNSGKRTYVKPVATTVKPAKVATPLAPASFTMPKDANITIYYDDFSIKKTFGGQIFCQMTFYIENNTPMILDALILGMKWSGLSTNLNIEGVTANDLKTERYALVGSGCYTMGEAPKLTIDKCMMRSFTPDGRVVDVPEDKCKSIVSFK